MASLARSTHLIATLELRTINLVFANRSFLQSDWLMRHTLKVALLTGLWKEESSHLISLLVEYFPLNDIHLCTYIYSSTTFFHSA